MLSPEVRRAAPPETTPTPAKEGDQARARRDEERRCKITFLNDVPSTLRLIPRPDKSILQLL